MDKISVEFIDFIKDLGEALNEFLTTPYGQLRLTNIPQATYYRKVKKFKKAGLIKRSPNSPIELTNKAKLLLKQPAKKQLRNDGYSTIIIFDIPNDKNRERTIFRRYLLRNRYIQLQESVLISPDELTQETKELINELKIKTFVCIISGKINYLD